MIENLPPQLRAKILVDDCWIWNGSLRSQSTGYGGIWWKGKTWNVHRLVYELLIGAVPAGKQLHHTCRNRRCCNPSHMEVLTIAEHRKVETGLKTHCAHGHPYDEANTYRSKTQRHCRICMRKNWRRYSQRKKAVKS